MRNKRIILACDYRGVELRDILLTKSKELGLDIEDIGIPAGSTLDYVDITKSLVEKLRNDPDACGVLVCGSGQGVAIYANRYNHIRATMCRTPEDAESVRSKLNANVMCLGNKYTSPEQSLECLLTFLDTPFKAERHGRCASKLDMSTIENS